MGWQRYIISGSSQEYFIHFPFPIARICPYFLTCGPASLQSLLPLSHLFLITALTPPSDKNPCDYIRPICIIRIISHFKALNLFTFAESLWLCKITYSKVSGMRTQTVLGWRGHHAIYHRGIGICNTH